MNATELTASNVDLTNSVVFSAGCHSGYTVVDGDAVPNVTQTLDWIQAFAQKRATVIAGTGYQYGDTDFLEYSERLYKNFAEAFRFGDGPGERRRRARVGQAAVPDGHADARRDPPEGAARGDALRPADVGGRPPGRAELRAAGRAADRRRHHARDAPTPGSALGSDASPT